MKKEYVYVLNSDGQPLMPTTRKAYVRKQLKAGNAKIVSYKPFTIQLMHVSTNTVQKLKLSLDPGRTNIGAAVISENGQCLYRCKLISRNKEIVKLMKERRGHRQMSRRGERKRRIRRAIVCGTVFNTKTKQRVLPNCKEPISVNYIKNTEAKYCNRKRLTEWLAPTANQLLLTHQNFVKKIEFILPISEISIELNKFDIARLDNPNIKSKDYQNGPLKGYDGVNAAVYDEQKGHCIFCNKPIDHYHHVIERSNGGSDTLNNLVGLCEHHHDLVHKNEDWQVKLKTKKEGLIKKYGGLNVLNQILPYFIKWLNNRYPNSVYVCEGYHTKKMREEDNIPKDHDLDAYCIGLATSDGISKVDFDIANIYEIEQFRRHNRQRIHRQTERTYKLGQKTVAKNRRKRTGQTDDSLHEWYIKTKKKVGILKARQLQSELRVIKSQRSYRDNELIEPGSVVLYNGERHIVIGSQNCGKYLFFRDTGYKKYYKSSNCKLVSHNHGLVYI